MNVLKRDGVTQQLFEPSKITNAIRKANAAIPEDKRITETTINAITESIVKECEAFDHLVTVEEIQEMVEDRLIDANAKAIAKEYIRYRFKRGMVRDKYKELMREVMKRFMAADVKNDNANMDERSFSGREGAAKDFIAKEYALNFLMSDLAKNAHLNNEIYTHDLSSYAIGDANCLTIPYDHLLNEGFDTRNTDIRASGSMNTASQLVAVIAQLQSLQQFGGVASGHIDTTLIPEIRKSFRKHYADGLKYVDWRQDNQIEAVMKGIPEDTPIDDKMYAKRHAVYVYACDLTKRECYQGVEALYHNLNSLQSRSGGQLPFTSINYGTAACAEGKMLINAILDVSIDGLGKKHRTSIFPCGIFQLRKGINMDKTDPLYDEYRKALKSTSLRLYPNYANLDWSVQQAGIKQDRDFKKSVLEKLSAEDKEKLKDAILDDPAQGLLVGLEVKDDNLQVIMEESPREMNSTMGCRTWNGYDIAFEDDYKENIRAVIDGKKLPSYTQFSGMQKDGRGNVCPVTIILPTIAMEAKTACTNLDDLQDDFLALLDRKINEAKDILLERFEYICSQPATAARFMYDNHLYVGYKPEEGIKSALRHGTLVIGQLGLAECLQVLMGCDHTDPKGMAFAHKIEGLFKKRCAEFKKFYRLNFGVYYSPKHHWAA